MNVQDERSTMNADVINAIRGYLLPLVPDHERQNFTTAVASLVAEEFRKLKAENDALRALIGTPPRGSHTDEHLPRAATWHAERLNWIAEVERLRAELAKGGSPSPVETL